MKKQLLFAVVLLGCHQPGPLGPTPVPRDTDMCAAAEARLKELACRDRNQNPMWMNKNGEPFAETCRTLQEEGGIFVDPACIVKSSDCTAARNCPPSAER